MTEEGSGLILEEGKLGSGFIRYIDNGASAKQAVVIDAIDMVVVRVRPLASYGGASREAGEGAIRGFAKYRQVIGAEGLPIPSYEIGLGKVVDVSEL